MDHPVVRTYRLGELETNCYLVGSLAEKAAAVIDPGGDTGAVERDLAALGLSLQVILCTHGHADHVAGLAGLQRRTGAQVALHRLDTEMLREPSLNLSQFLGAPLSLDCCDVSLEDGSVVAVGSLSFTVIHSPGHTPGSVCYFLDKMLFSGDTLFREGIGRWDLPGGDGVQLRRSVLDRIMPLADDILVYPGHGPHTTIGHERRSNPFLTQPEAYFA